MAENLNVHETNARFESSSGVRRRALTKEDLLAYSLTQLGFPVTDVEIQRVQFELLFERALDEYNKWLPIEKFDVLDSVTSSLNKYDLRDLKRPYGRGVVDVKIGTRETFFSPISGVFALGIPHPISHLSPDQYDLALRYIKVARKVYSSEPDWEWEEPILWIYGPSGFGGPFVAAYTYFQDVSKAEEVATQDWGIFKDYTYNLVKKAVGESRRKFGGIPGPAGQNISGTELVAEADVAILRLQAEYETKSYARIPPIGPGGNF